MTWPLPRLNPPPPCCFPRPRKFPPPFADGIVDVVDTGSIDIVVFEIVVMDIKQVDTEVALIQLASSHHSSLSRYPPFSLAEDEMLYNLSHCVLQIYKNYNTY